jgi:hypothetical protein
LAQWEQSQLIPSVERLAEIDTAPLLALNAMSASSAIKANTDVP